MIVDNRVRDLCAALEENPQASPSVAHALVRAVHGNANVFTHRLRNAVLNLRVNGISRYPVDEQGYAVAYDPLTQEAEFYDAFQRYGMVVGKSIIAPLQAARTIRAISDRFNRLSRGRAQVDNAATYDHMAKDAKGFPVINNGFLEIYHDNVLAQLRQNPRAYIHHAIIWQRADLWTSFDRVGVKTGGDANSSAALPLHVDQNPAVHPGFKTVQGVLALTDCPAERGTFVGVPGSRRYFADYEAAALRMANPRGEFVPLDDTVLNHDVLRENAQAIPLRAGDMVTWDSRTTHANTANVSNDMRMVFYMAAGPAREDRIDLRTMRKEAFDAGTGLNNREALMHASKKQRFTDYAALGDVREAERLTTLGRLLYGFDRYDKIFPSYRR